MLQRTFWICLCLAAVSLASAASPDAFKQLLVLVPHDFHAGSQVLPAGHYRVTVLEGDPQQVQIRNVTLGSTATLGVVSRLAVGYPTDRGVRLVFDQVTGQYFLSEIWIAGQDGYMFHSTAEEHTRKVIASIQ
jgi:hypothetical protein